MPLTFQGQYNRKGLNMRLLPQLLLFWFLFSSLSFAQDQDKDPVDLSMVISGGVSLGAYEAGYNWAMIKMLTHIKHHGQYVDPHMRSVTGASAGSINALLSAVYWCQEDTNATKNQITNNLFYDTWVKLGLEDLIIKGDTEPGNKSSLFTRKVLTEKADAILTHMSQPIFSQGCEVPMGFSVTKAKPMTITLSNSDIEIKNQHFSVPLTLRESNGRLTIENRMIENSQDHLIHIPDIENNITKVREVLFASSAFPGAFEQVKLDYRYNGVNYSSYFIDGGAYDNLPLLLAQELSQYNKLDPKRRYFVVIDPDNIRPKPVEGSTVEPENKPVGFLNANTLPLFNAVEIFRSMYLYNAIHQYFRDNPDNRLILSSRHHPITGQFLGAFGAFLNEDFRIYDYYVGVYDAVYHLAHEMHERPYYATQTPEAIMDNLSEQLGIKSNPEAFRAYTLFYNTEINQVKNPPTTDNFSTIYNAFNLQVDESKRYDLTAFDSFLSKLQMHYIQDRDSFIPTDSTEQSEWYKKPLQEMISRVSILENEYARDENNSDTLAGVTNVMAWMGNNMIKQKEGFDPLPLNIPDNPKNKRLANILRAIPNELTSDVKNGGLGVSYNAYWYQKQSMIDGLEGKTSFNQNDDINDFMRVDLSMFEEYKNFLRIGMGASLFGNLEGKFYEREGFYGVNGYIDLLDIFRITYVRRFDHPTERDYLYFGIRNLPSLYYWLNR